MVIWRIKSCWEYMSLAYANGDDVRYVMKYERGELTKWHPVLVKYDTDVSDDTDERFERVSNFPSISGNITCDEEAKSILVDLVYDHAEFLPLLSATITDKQYYILYPKTTLDCLDKERTEYSYLSERKKHLRSIKSYAFHSNRIGDTPMFRLPRGAAFEPFVNDKFKQLIEDYNLTGLQFKKIWEG